VESLKGEKSSINPKKYFFFRFLTIRFASLKGCVGFLVPWVHSYITAEDMSSIGLKGVAIINKIGIYNFNSL